MLLLISALLVSSAFGFALPPVQSDAFDPTNLVSYAFALDIYNPANVNQFKCFKQNGYSVVFIRGYSPAGQGTFDANSVTNINNAYSGNIGSEVYMTPQPVSSKQGYQQFDELYNGLKAKSITVRQVWLQVTSPVNWNRNATNNINFINSIVMRAKSYNLGIAIYTNQYDWSQIAASSTYFSNSGVGLWYWNVAGAGLGGETAPNFNDFRTFGGWTGANVKQFAQAEGVCNVTVNRDVYAVTSKMASFEKTEGIVVGGSIQF